MNSWKPMPVDRCDPHAFFARNWDGGVSPRRHPPAAKLPIPPICRVSCSGAPLGKRRGVAKGWDFHRWPNAFFTEQGLYSLVAAHASACQSSWR
jgi:hypothetical protein